METPRSVLGREGGYLMLSGRVVDGTIAYLIATHVDSLRMRRVSFNRGMHPFLVLQVTLTFTKNTYGKWYSTCADSRMGSNVTDRRLRSATFFVSSATDGLKYNL